MKTNLLPLTMGGLLVVGTAFHFLTKPPMANALAALDQSISVVKNCTAFAKGIPQWLEGKPGIQEGSVFTLLVMGRDAVNQEPNPVVTSLIPVKSDIVIGADPQSYSNAQAELSGEVKRACDTAKAGRQSPIYQMVRQAIALLRGPKGEGHGYVLLKSDLDDDAHPVLSAVLRKAAQDPNVAVPAEIAGSLANTKVSVDICGTAELTPRKGGGPTASFDTRLRIWKALFTHPELVTTQPFCNPERMQ